MKFILITIIILSSYAFSANWYEAVTSNKNMTPQRSMNLVSRVKQLENRLDKVESDVEFLAKLISELRKKN